MRSLLFALLLLPTLASAQTITIGPIAKTEFCIGDTMSIPYTASGSFGSSNHFFAEVTDNSGNFMQIRTRS